MADDSYAIVVDVKPPEPNCLIDIPFGNGFDGVFRAIQAAANGVRLTPIRVDQLRKSGPFPQQVVELTQTARLVVAVCSPDGDVPNPNVMYELGLALALGKPTLILTSDAGKLPADICTFASLVYDPAENHVALAARIENEMRKFLVRLTDHLTNPDSQGIWLARAKHRMLLKSQFWKSFGCVFQYANAVRNEVEGVYRDFMHDVHRHAQEILDSSEEDGRIGVGPFRAVWRKYVAHYNETTVRLLTPPNGFAVALKELDEVAKDADTKEQIVRIDRYFALVQKRLNGFRVIHHRTARTCESFLRDSSNADLSSRFHIQIHELVDAVKALADYASGLVDNMVDMVAEGFEEADVPEQPPARVLSA